MLSEFGIFGCSGNPGQEVNIPMWPQICEAWVLSSSVDGAEIMIKSGSDGGQRVAKDHKRTISGLNACGFVNGV